MTSRVWGRLLKSFERTRAIKTRSPRHGNGRVRKLPSYNSLRDEVTRSDCLRESGPGDKKSWPGVTTT